MRHQARLLHDRAESYFADEHKPADLRPEVSSECLVFRDCKRFRNIIDISHKAFFQIDAFSSWR
jgi:hypothetical protein